MSSVNTVASTSEGHSSARNAREFFSLLVWKTERNSVSNDGSARHLILEEKQLHPDALLRADILLSSLMVPVLQTDTKFLQNTKQAKGRGYQHSQELYNPNRQPTYL